MKNIINKFVFLMILLIVVILATNCGVNENHHLETNRNLWKSKQIKNYRYVFDLFAFSNNAGKPVLIEVRDGKETKMECVKECTPENIEYFAKNNSVEKLFDVIKSAIESKPASIEVTYDEKLGYPLRIKVTTSNTATDSTWIINIKDFELIG